MSNFLFQYRTTPHTVTGVSPAEILMGRNLGDKLPKVKVQTDRVTEGEWQVLLGERYAKAKLRQRENADKTTAATPTDTKEGDAVLRESKRSDKLIPQYEPDPYRVVKRNGNAVILEDNTGRTKMRNTAHMKKLRIRQDLANEDGSQSGSRAEVDARKHRDPGTRPKRSRHPPNWLGEYICKDR